MWDKSDDVFVTVRTGEEAFARTLRFDVVVALLPLGDYRPGQTLRPNRLEAVEAVGQTQCDQDAPHRELFHEHVRGVQPVELGQPTQQTRAERHGSEHQPRAQPLSQVESVSCPVPELLLVGTPDDGEENHQHEPHRRVRQAPVDAAVLHEEELSGVDEVQHAPREAEADDDESAHCEHDKTLVHVSLLSSFCGVQTDRQRMPNLWNKMFPLGRGAARHFTSSPDASSLAQDLR